jgi:hypothetical protein
MSDDINDTIPSPPPLESTPPIDTIRSITIPEEDIPDKPSTPETAVA